MKKNKENWLDRYMKFWYGISGPLDEYRQAKIDHIGNRAFFIAFLSLTTLFIISSILFANFGAVVAYRVLLAESFLIIIVIDFYVMRETRKFKLTENEVSAKDYPQARKNAIKRGLLSGVLFGVLMFLFEFLTNIHMDSFELWLNLLIAGVGGALFFGAFAAAMYVSRIKVVKDDE
ncbi:MULTISPECIES: DUF3278 domain-containing protein [Lactobacillus]|nr:MULTISPECIES: DUF3278 domain-containing protein [Lactobacillus]